MQLSRMLIAPSTKGGNHALSDRPDARRVRHVRTVGCFRQGTCVRQGMSRASLELPVWCEPGSPRLQRPRGYFCLRCERQKLLEYLPGEVASCCLLGEKVGAKVVGRN